MNKNADYNLFMGNYYDRLQDKININKTFIDKLVQEAKATPELQVSINIEDIKDYNSKPTFEVKVKDLIYYLQHLCKCQVTYSSQNTFTFFKTLKPSLRHNTESDYFPDIDGNPKTDECFIFPIIISTLIVMLGILATSLLEPASLSILTILPLILSVLFVVIFIGGYYLNYYLTYKKSVEIFNYINNKLKGI